MTISFQNWIEWVFDHPVEETAWHFKSSNDLHLPPKTNLAYLTKLFSNATDALKMFSNPQIDQGFNFLVHTVCSDHMCCIFDESLPHEDRLKCIKSITTLYRDFFSKKCSENFSPGHLRIANPLDNTAYMWWDLMTCSGETSSADQLQLTREACIDSMGEIINIASAV